nr:CopG family antitoxin [Oceaniferula marina]
MVKNKDTIKAEDLDKKFDAGEDISQYLNWDKAVRPGLEQRRVNVDLPIWMINSLDVEAKRVGVTRQSVVKVWLAERLKAEQVAAPDH